MLTAAVLILAIALPAVVLLTLLLGWRHFLDTDRKRRSPLETQHFAGIPGDSIRRKLRHHDEKFDEAVLSAMLVGPIVVGAWAVARLHALDALVFRAWDWLLVATGAVLIALAARRAIRHGKRRRDCKHGLEAELMTAQNLMPLVSEGCQIYHDLPCDGFNIDHVAVAPNAVFAVETKSRRKPSRDVKEGHRVRYDGRGLQFPDHATTQPVEQARRQAQWLSKYLSGATGDHVPVVPVLVLPGWYVDPTAEGRDAEVIVLNGKGAEKWLPRVRRHQPFDVAAQRRIGHALLQRYPADAKPVV